MLQKLLIGISCLWLLAPAWAADSAPPIDQWVSELKDGDAEARREAAYQLHQLGREALPALPALIEGLGDREQQVWFHCLMAIAAIGPDAAPAIPKLMETFNQGQRRRGDAQVSYRTAYALGCIGPAALPVLREAVASDNNNRQEGAARALGFMGSAAAPAIPELLALFHESDQELRDVAVETFGLVGAEAVEPLRQTLSVEDREARASAALALGEIGQAALPAAQQLAELARQDPASLVRGSAIEALRRLGYPDLLPLLLERLASGAEADPETVEEEADQKAAVDALLLLRPAEQVTVPALIPLLQSPEAALAARAAHVLGRIGPPAQAAIPSLVRRLEGDPTREATYVEALANIGPAAAPPLLSKLGQVNPSALSNHWSFSSLKAMETRAVPALAAALSDANDQVRLAALLLLADLGPQARSASSRVVGLVEDPEPLVRAQAIHTALALDASLQPVRRQLIDLLNDPNPPVRAATALAMPSLGDEAKEAVPALLVLADDPDPNLAAIAVQALGAVPADNKEQIARRLVVKVDSSHLSLRKATIQTLGHLGAAAELAVDQIDPVAREAEKDLRMVAIEALGNIGAPTGRATLTELIKDEDSDIRASAALALGKLNDASVLPRLVEALDDPQSAVRRNAAASIGRLGPAGREATAPLFVLLKEQKDWEAALQAAQAIEVTSVPHLIDILQNREPAVRLYACRQLRSLGSEAKEALPALRPLLEDRYDFVQRQARRAIQSIERDQ